MSIEFNSSNVSSLCFGPLLPLYCLRWERQGEASQVKSVYSYSCLLPCKTYAVPFLIFDCAVLSRHVQRPCFGTHADLQHIQTHWARPGLPPFVRASSFRATRWNMWVDSTVLCWGKKHHWRNFALCNTVANHAVSGVSVLQPLNLQGMLHTSHTSMQYTSHHHHMQYHNKCYAAMYF